jgi:hypothetical protein
MSDSVRPALASASLSQPHSNTTHDLRTTGQLVRQAVLLVSVAFTSLVVVSYVVWKTATPHWTTGGYPSFIGYGKNVEHLALKLAALAAVGVGLAMPRFARIRWGVLLAAGLAAIPTWYALVPQKRWALFVMLAVNAAYFAWWYARDENKSPATPLREPWPRWISALLVLGGMTLAFFQIMVPSGIDLFHHGEIILCAHDWLAGGKPYETMFWPHGMGDSWLPAQFMKLTGNEGLGIVILSLTTWGMCGMVCIYLIAWNTIRRHGDAAIATLLIGGILPMLALTLGKGIFGIVALHLLANYSSRRTLLIAGLLLAWGFLWRMDVGIFAIVTACGFLVFDEYYTRGYQTGATLWSTVVHREHFRRAAGCLAWLVGGMATMFLFTRLVIGLPTLTMLNVALIELPKYHADNTGYPLPMPLWLLDGKTIEPLLVMRWLTANFLLFCTALAMFLAVKSRERRLGLGTAQARFLAMAMFYGLLHLKSAIDRSDYGHIVFAIIPLTTICCIDGIGWITARITLPRVRALAVALLVFISFAGGVLGAVARDFRGGPLLAQFVLVKHRLTTPHVTWNALLTCLRPTRHWHELLTPSGDPWQNKVLTGAGQMRRILEEHHIGQRQFLVSHSGPLIYPLVDRTSPTKYYMLGWAMNDWMQEECVRELQDSNVQAILKCNGWSGALPYYDCPDEHRIPIIHRQLQATLDACMVYATELGEMHVRPPQTMPGYRLSCKPGEAPYLETPQGRMPLVPDGDLGNIDVYQDEGAMLRLRGWAGDRLTGQHADTLLVFEGERCLSPLAAYSVRTDVAEVFQKPSLLDAGIDAHMPKSWLTSGDLSQLHVVAICGDKAAVLTVGSQTVAQRQAGARK